MYITRINSRFMMRSRMLGHKGGVGLFYCLWFRTLLKVALSLLKFLLLFATVVTTIVTNTNEFNQFLDKSNSSETILLKTTRGLERELTNNERKTPQDRGREIFAAINMIKFCVGTVGTITILGEANSRDICTN
uniref:Uncharacterized protein n=1 Tax=Glossina austeni TaxID=7395 RepID=A0A1A9URH8_GLOAU